jgi:predicted phage tail protein
MKTFTIEGDLIDYVGREIAIDCKTIRECFEALFFTFPQFKKYYLEKIISGTEYLFIDSNGEILESFCYDLILTDSHYRIVPMFKGSAGGPIFGFVMNAAMSYGMQKLADKMNPIDETGEEYEIIETNSHLYQSNENAVAQGTPIPIVYGQLRVGSLVVNSNIQNYDYDFENAEIYNSKQVLSLPGNLSSKDFLAGSEAFGSDYNLRAGYYEPGSEGVIGRYKSSAEDSSKRKSLSFSNDGTKSYDQDHNNEPYAYQYSDDTEAGGYAKFLGPAKIGQEARSSTSDPSSAGHKSAGSVKPYLFPPAGDRDINFRPSQKTEPCYTIRPLQTANGTTERLSNLRVGDRGQYQKLESIGVYRTLDVLSEGPIAGLALPLLDSSSYDTVQGFSNDNGSVSIALDNNIEFFNSAGVAAKVGGVQFSNTVGHLVSSENTGSSSLNIIRGGSNYEPNLNNAVINVNDPDELIYIRMTKPLSAEDASFADLSFGDQESYGFSVVTPRNNTFGGVGVMSFNKIFALFEHVVPENLASDATYKGLLILNPFSNQDTRINADLRIPANYVTQTLNYSHFPSLAEIAVNQTLNLANISANDPSFNMGDGFSDLSKSNSSQYITFTPEDAPVNLTARIDYLDSFERQSQAEAFDFKFLVGAGDPRSRITGNDSLLKATGAGVLLGNSPPFMPAGNGWSNFVRLYYDTRGNGIPAATLNTTRTFHMGIRHVCFGREDRRFFRCTNTAYSTYTLTLSLRQYLELPNVTPTRFNWSTNSSNCGGCASATQRSSPNSIADDSTGGRFPDQTTNWTRYTVFRPNPDNPEENINDFDRLIDEGSIPLAYLLRNSTFGRAVWNAFSNLHNIQQAQYSTYVDSGNQVFNPVYFRMTPGSGHTGDNGIVALMDNGTVPFYTYNHNNPGQLNSVTIPKPGFIPSVASSIPGDESANPKGFYIPDLFYRVEVLVLRKSRSSGSSSRFTYEFKNTNIDCFAQINENGVVSSVHLAGVSDEPVWDSLLGKWTPFSITHPNRPMISDTRGELGSVETYYQDLAIVLNIDSSHDFQSCAVRVANGQIQSPTGNPLVDQKKLEVYANYDDYITSKLLADITNIPGQVARGVCPDNMTIANSTKSFSLADLYKSNGAVLAQGFTTAASVSVRCERVNLNGARYNMLNSIPNNKLRVELGNNTSTISAFYTGRVTGLTVTNSGSGYRGHDGNNLSGPFLQFDVYNKMMAIKELTVNRIFRYSNKGYRRNSEIFIHGSLSTNNFGFATTAGSYLWRRYQFKAVLRTNENGVIVNKVQVLDPGYSNNENLNSITLAINNYHQNWFKNRYWIDDSQIVFGNSLASFSDRGSSPIEPKENDSDPDVTYNEQFLNNQDDYNYTQTLTSNRFMGINNDNARNLIPAIQLFKQQFHLRIDPESASEPGLEGKIAYVTCSQAGLGFNTNFSEFKDLESDNDPVRFLVSTSADGEITSIRVDQDSSSGGYSESDGSISVRIGAPVVETTVGEIIPANQDQYGWARSVYLNNTPIRDKDKRFNYANFHFDFLGGYFKNGNRDTNVDIDRVNSDYNESLMSDEFQFPSQTYKVDYPLIPPRNNGEKDYCYTHTIKNPAVSNVSLTFKVNELHYIYEGDECMVFLNLKPIIGGIIGWLLAKQLAQKVIEMVVPDFGIDATSSGGFSGPCGGPVASQGAGPGLTNNALSGAVGVGIQETIIQIASAAAGLLGGVLGFALGNKFPCKGSGGFLCIKIGSVIKNSGEIWPAKLTLGVEHGIEGETLTQEEIVIQGCGTNAFMKDIFLSRFSLTAKIPNTNIYKNRIIKVWRKTREFDPVSAGIMEARYKIDAELFSVNEFVGGYFKYPNTAIMGTRINSKDTPNIPNREYLIKGKLVKIPNGYSPETGTYGGSDTRADSFFKLDTRGNPDLSWTSNPAWIIYDLLINPIYGMGKYGITDDDIDKWSFLKFSQRADEPVDVIVDSVNTKERRYMCNLYVNQQRPAYEYIKELLLLYDTKLHFSGGKIYISIDEPGDSIMLFNNFNVSESGFSYSCTPKQNRITACSVDYLDERDHYMMKTEYFEDPALIDEFGYSHIKIAGIAITRRGEANRLALSKVYSKQLETEIIQFVTNLQGSYLRIGDVIDVIDNNKTSSHSGGIITKILSSKVIELDIPVSALPNTVNTIWIQDIVDSTDDTEEEEGDHTAQYVEYTISKNSGFQVTLNNALSSNVKAGFSWIVKKGSDSHGNIKPKQYRVKSVKEVDHLQYEIQALEYIPEKYNVIDGTVNNDVELGYDAHNIIVP